MHEHVPGPSGSGCVVLELGAGVGALVLHTPRELNGREIEISPPGGTTAPRTHSRVRPRITSRGTRYAAVYPQLAAGTYTVWQDAVTPIATVTVHGGQVTTAWWPSPSRESDWSSNDDLPSVVVASPPAGGSGSE